MRKVTITKADTKRKHPCVRDLEPGDKFRITGEDEWYLRTNEDDRPAVRILEGTIVFTGIFSDQVSEVLAPGESLTIGPEVE